METFTRALVVFLSAYFYGIQGQEQFFTDFVKFCNAKNPVYITTDEIDESFIMDIRKGNSTKTLIRYTASKEEKNVARHLHKLDLLGELNVIVFLDDGHHQKLQSLLINEFHLLKKGVTWLLPESIRVPGLSMKLRLDTRLFLYINWGRSIHLKEMYAVLGKTIIREIGTWDEEKGLSVTSTNIWERRTDMMGITIRVATVNFPILHEILYDKSETSIIGGRGLYLDPIYSLQERLNFTCKLIPSVDGYFGGSGINGSWNGVVGMLIKGQADIAAAALIITKERSGVISYSIPLAYEIITISVEQNTRLETDAMIYMKIFPQAAWYVTGAIAIIIAFCFTFMNHSGINSMHNESDSETFNLLNGLGLSLTFFRQIYYDVNITSISTKILFILSAVSTYLLYVHYTAYLTAACTSIKGSSVKSFNDVLKGGYRLIVLENTVAHGMLKSAKPGSPLHELYKKMIGRGDDFVLSYKEAYEMLCLEKTMYFGSHMITFAYDDIIPLDIQEYLM